MRTDNTGHMGPSVSLGSAPLVNQLMNQAEALRVGVSRSPTGATLIDAGINSRGGLEAGRIITEICMGGLGRVTIHGGSGIPEWPMAISVHSCQPVLACLGSQYAGWSLAHGKGKDGFQALGSGPARALALKEPLFEEMGYRDRASKSCLVLEVDKVPPDALLEKIVTDCRLPGAESLTVILTPTQSLAGIVQVVGRVLEVALHKVHTLGFPLEQVIDGQGWAPLPPAGGDFLTAMGRTNDAIIFGGTVTLHVDCDDDAAQQLAEAMPSSVSRDYGTPFAELLKRFEFDFYKMDPHLFSPAHVIINALPSGRRFTAGAVDPEALTKALARRAGQGVTA